jgi:hypothetical protein
MLTQLKRASRLCAALSWAVALLFALAPSVAMAYAAPAGAFSAIFVHAHEHGDEDHDHHEHHHGHVHAGGEDHHYHPADDGRQGDPGQPCLHVHFDVCCPSVLVPVQTAAPLQHRVADRLALPRVEPLEGAPPDRLLRPPIPSPLF